MYFSTTLSFFLAALVAASPYPSSNDQPGLVTLIMSEPDCPSIKDYCTHCNGDFNCETDPRCEWCYKHEQFGHDDEGDN